MTTTASSTWQTCCSPRLPSLRGLWEMRVAAAVADPYRPAMDLKLQRPRGVCARTGRTLSAGEPMVSALVRDAGTLERIDCVAEAWEGPPAGTLAWWRSVYAPAAATGPTLAPADVLLDVFEELEARPDETALRYLIALQLVRRKVLRIVERAADVGDDSADRDTLFVACRKRRSEYRVTVVSPQAVVAEGVEERLQALLWSGGEA
jgi:hypothetical protein